MAVALIRFGLVVNGTQQMAVSDYQGVAIEDELVLWVVTLGVSNEDMQLNVPAFVFEFASSTT